MNRTTSAAIKMAVKRAKKAGTIEAGFESLKKWHDANQARDIATALKCYKKVIKKGIC